MSVPTIGQWTLSEDEYRTRAENYGGICLACGEWTDSGVEPDARYYKCESCGGCEVFGVEEALIMGRISLSEDEESECSEGEGA